MEDSDNRASQNPILWSNTEPVPLVEHADSFHAVYGIYALAILSNFVFYCTELPLLRLTENKICYSHLGVHASGHFLGHAIGESQCKIPEIQDALAFFIGAKTAFDALPPLLTSLWYGKMADRVGRRTVIALACTGELLNLLWVLFVGLFDYVNDYQMVWFAALFLLVGGGQFLLYAMFSLAIVDVVKDSER